MINKLKSGVIEKEDQQKCKGLKVETNKLLHSLRKFYSPVHFSFSDAVAPRFTTA